MVFLAGDVPLQYLRHVWGLRSWDFLIAVTPYDLHRCAVVIQVIQILLHANAQLG